MKTIRIDYFRGENQWKLLKEEYTLRT
jgi:hypothetical protein